MEANFPKPMKYINPELQKIEKITSSINTKKATHKHIKVKMLGEKSSQGKRHNTLRKKTKIIMVEFWIETTGTRRQISDIYKNLPR